MTDLTGSREFRYLAIGLTVFFVLLYSFNSLSNSPQVGATTINCNISMNSPQVDDQDVPDKYKGKSAAELVRMHQEAEKMAGRQGNEVGGATTINCNISDVTDPVLLMAYYFPQFHDVPENYPVGSNRSWTDWDNIKLALKHPDGADVFHPMESETLGYYNLTQVAPRRAQGQLAKKYGLDGFIFYHYWFNQGAVMDKPLLLRLKDGQPAGQFYFVGRTRTGICSTAGQEKGHTL